MMLCSFELRSVLMYIGNLSIVGCYECEWLVISLIIIYIGVKTHDNDNSIIYIFIFYSRIFPCIWA